MRPAVVSVFVLIVGGLVLATPGRAGDRYEAEQMTLVDGYARTVDYADASGGQAVRMTRTTAITGPATTNGPTHFVVRARGEDCQGSPEMVVRIDGAEILRVTVTANDWADYTGDTPVPEGVHQVEVAFTNDNYVAGVCDRNLEVDRVEFDAIEPSHVEAEEMSIPSGYAYVADNPDASGGQTVRMMRNTTISTTHETAGTTRVVVRARGDYCHGAPTMVVRIDGDEILRTPVRGSGWDGYAVDTTLPDGPHTVQVAFANDLYDPGVCDRNLVVDRIDFLTGLSSPAAGLSFDGDFESGDLSQWTWTQEASPDRIQVVRDPAREGRYAARVEVQNGDSVYGGARAEMLWGDDRTPTLHEGDDLYFGWSTRFANDFPSPDPTQGHTTFLQWKNVGSGSPPLDMSAAREHITLRTLDGDPWTIPLERGVWHDFVVHVRFSADPATGFVEVWHNGVKVLPEFHVQTLYAGIDGYLKVGYYRNPSILPDGVLWDDGVRVADSFDAVKPW